MWNPIRSEPRFRVLMSQQQAKIDRQRKLLEEMRRKDEVIAREDPTATRTNSD